MKVIHRLWLTYKITSCGEQQPVIVSRFIMATKWLRSLTDIRSLTLLDFRQTSPIYFLLGYRQNTIRVTYSSAASASRFLTCSLASLTAALAEARARSASRSAASAWKTLCRAEVMEGSSLLRCRTLWRPLLRVLDRAGELGGETSGEDPRRRENKPCLDPLVEVELRAGDGVGWTGSSFLSLPKRGITFFITAL